jgi:hypothetical protein
MAQLAFLMGSSEQLIPDINGGKLAQEVRLNEPMGRLGYLGNEPYIGIGRLGYLGNEPYIGIGRLVYLGNEPYIGIGRLGYLGK